MTRGGARALRLLVLRVVQSLPSGCVEYYRSEHYHRAPDWSAQILVEVLLALPREYTRDPRLAPVLEWARRSHRFFQIATRPRKAEPADNQARRRAAN